MHCSNTRISNEPAFENNPLAPGQSRVAVVGAGLMGRNITLANLEAGYSVLLNEASPEVLAASMAVIESQTCLRPKIHPHQASGPPHAVGSVTSASAIAALSPADVVIEAVVENLGIKRKLFKTLESTVAPDAILASNTSSLSISKLASSLKHPERFCGLHFCHPVQERPLVEVVRGAQTTEATIDRAVDYVQRLGKQPLVVEDRPGFVVNRLLFLYLNQALALLDEGVDFELIEAPAVEFGMPVGPLAAIDSIGVDVALRVGSILQRAYPQQVASTPLLVELYAAQKWGEKTGEGIYCYQHGKRIPRLSTVVDECLARPNRPASGSVRQTLSRTDVISRLLLPLAIEATRMQQENSNLHAADIDNALIAGLGFPRGVLTWADSLGHALLKNELARWGHLGSQFQPGELFAQHLATGRPFCETQIRKAA